MALIIIYLVAEDFDIKIANLVFDYFKLLPIKELFIRGKFNLLVGLLLNVQILGVAYSYRYLVKLQN